MEAHSSVCQRGCHHCPAGNGTAEGRLEAVKESTLQSYCEIGEGRYTAHGMNESTTTSPRLVSINCRQLVLHSVDVDRLIGEDHRARLIWELVGRLDLGPQSRPDCVGRRARRTRAY